MYSPVQLLHANKKKDGFQKILIKAHPSLWTKIKQVISSSGLS
jgi:hypothetical protein